MSNYIRRNKPLPTPGQIWSRLSNSFTSNRREVFRVVSLDNNRKVVNVVFLDEELHDDHIGTVSYNVFVKTQRGIKEVSP